MSSRYQLQGSAVGASGRIFEPFQDLIQIQAASALPPSGGFGSASVSRFEFRDIFRFDLAQTVVAGSQSDDREYPNLCAHVKTSIEGLNIMDMVTADRIVASLAVSYPGSAAEPPDPCGETSYKFIGTRFENLRIAGVPVKVDLAFDVVDRLHTNPALLDAGSSDEGARNLFENTSLKSRIQDAPEAVKRWFQKSQGKSISLAKKIEAESAHLPCFGHVIHVEGFGTIRLAELNIGKCSRGVTMVQVDLCCPYKGSIHTLSVDVGGSGN